MKFLQQRFLIPRELPIESNTKQSLRNERLSLGISASRNFENETGTELKSEFPNSQIRRPFQTVTFIFTLQRGFRER